MNRILPVFFTFWIVSVLSLAAQNAVYHDYKAPLGAAVQPVYESDDFMPVVINLEQPFPGGDKKFLAEQKVLSAQRYKRQSVPQPKQNKAAVTPLIIKQYLTNSNSGIPPDNYVAVSNDGKMASMINSNLWFWDTQLDTCYLKRSNSAFTNNLGLNGLNYGRSDPKMIYDPYADRFLFVLMAGADQYSNLIFGFSQTNDPGGAWNMYRVPGNPFNDTTWYDYPAIAVTEHEYFVTGNQLRHNSSWQTGFKQSIVYQIKKESGYTADSLEYRIWSDIKYNGRPIRNLHCVKGGDRLYGPEQYFLSNRNFAIQNDTIFLLKITDTLGAPGAQLQVKALIADKPYGIPPEARQKGTNTQRLATNDARVLGGFIFNNEIQFVSNTIDTLSGNAAVYHGIIPDITQAQPQLNVQLIGVDSLDLGYPNITKMAEEKTHASAMISFNHSGPNRYPGYTALYFDGDEYSDMVTIREGEDFIAPLSGASQRWGDYSGSQIVWNNKGLVWITGIHGLAGAAHYGNTATLLGMYYAGMPPAPENVPVSYIYPNPAPEIINVEFSTKDKADWSFEVYDMAGRSCGLNFRYTCKAGKNVLGILVNSLPAGTYILRGNSASEQFSHKFIKQ